MDYARRIESLHEHPSTNNSEPPVNTPGGTFAIHSKIEKVLTPPLDAHEYMRQIGEAERRGDLKYFGAVGGLPVVYHSQGERRFRFFDNFTHLPSNDANINESAATLETPQQELLDPMPRSAQSAASSALWGARMYDKIIIDVRGDTLNEANTRHLSDIGKQTLNHYLQKRSGHQQTNRPRVLELGAGAGVAAGDAHAMGAIVDSVALTPTDPVHRLTMSWEELYGIVADAFGGQSNAWETWQQRMESLNMDTQTIAGLRRLYYCAQHDPMHLKKMDYPLGTRLVLALHQLFPERRIFESEEKPFIENQYIGSFADTVDIPSHRYQLLHDNNGPLFYLSQDSERPISRLLCEINHLLADDGAVVCTRIAMDTSGIKNRASLVNLWQQIQPSLYATINREHLQGSVQLDRDFRTTQRKNADLMTPVNSPIVVPNSQDLILIGEGNEAPMVFAKNKSPIAQHMRKKLNLSNGQGGFYVVPNLLEILQCNE